MFDDETAKLIQQIESSMYELFSVVNKNSLHVSLHRAKAEENRLQIMANSVANDVALRDVATKGLEAHLTSCLQDLNEIKTGDLDQQLHVKFSTLKLMAEHLKARIEINKGLIEINKSLVGINKSMITLNRRSAQFTDEIVLAAASTDLQHDAIMSDALEENYKVSEAMLIELREACHSLAQSASQNTGELEQLNQESDQNRVAIARNNLKIHQVIDMVLEVTDTKI